LTKYNDPSIKEKPYFGLPDLSFYLPLTCDLRRHLLSGVTLTPFGRNGIRYFRDSGMYTFRAINAGVAGSLEYVFGDKRQYGFGLAGGYDLNWNFKEKFFKDGKRSQKTIIYSGAGSGRMNTSSYSYSVFFYIFGVRLFYTRQPEYFINNKYYSEGQYPYSGFPSSRSQIGIGFNVKTAQGRGIPPMTNEDITRVGVLDKSLPLSIDRYAHALFTNLSVKNNQNDTASYRPTLSREEEAFILKDLYEREKKILKQFKKLPQYSDSLRYDASIPNPEFELRPLPQRLISATRGPDSAYINVNVGFLQKIVNYTLTNRPIQEFSGGILEDLRGQDNSNSGFWNQVTNSYMRLIQKRFSNAMANLGKYQMANEFEDLLTFCLAHETAHLYFDGESNVITMAQEVRADEVGFLITAELSPAAREQINFNETFLRTGQSNETNPYAVAQALSAPGWDYLFDIFSGTVMESDGVHPSMAARSANIEQLLWQSFQSDENKRLFPNAFNRLQKIFHH